MSGTSKGRVTLKSATPGDDGTGQVGQKTIRSACMHCLQRRQSITRYGGNASSKHLIVFPSETTVEMKDREGPKGTEAQEWTDVLV